MAKQEHRDGVGSGADGVREPDGRGPSIADRHLWEIQPIRDGLVIASVFGLLYVGSLLSTVTVPLLLAMLLAYLFEPVVRRMTRLKWVSREGAAVAIIVAAVLVFVVPVTLTLAFGVRQGVGLARTGADRLVVLEDVVRKGGGAEQYERLPGTAWVWVAEQLVDYRGRSQAEDDGAKEEDGGAGEKSGAASEGEASAPTTAEDDGGGGASSGDQGSEEGEGSEVDGEVGADAEEESPLLLSDDSAKLLDGVVSELSKWAGQYKARIGEQAWVTTVNLATLGYNLIVKLGLLGFGAFLTAFFFFFFSTGYGKVLEFWHSMIPKDKKEQWTDLARRMDGVIAGFIRGRITICFILAVMFTIGYAVIGVPGALLLGPVIGVLSIVPYAALIGVPISIALLLLNPNSVDGFQGEIWWIFGAPTALYFLIQASDDYFLTPRIQGDSTGMDTPTVLFASLAGGILAGFYGLLVAIPIAACIRIVLIEVVWPKLKAWLAGEARDPLPLGRKSPGESSASGG